jgi:DNA-binding CsgD family transcriptional regulator
VASHPRKVGSSARRWAPYPAGVAATAGPHRALAGALRICASAAGDRPLRQRLLEEMRRFVAFDAYAWVLTDPQTCVGSAPLADVPSLLELPALIRLRYATPLNRWTSLDPPVARLSAATDGDLSRSLLWRELLCRYDVSDVASVVFRDRYGCWAFLELWRTGGGTFGEEEAAYLAGLVPEATAALRRCVAGTVGRAAPDRAAIGPLVLLLSPDLSVARWTPGTADALRLLVPRDDVGPPVPAGAYNVAAQLLAVEAGIDDHPATARVHLAEGRWLRFAAARLQGDDPATPPGIAVTIESCTPGERAALLGRSCGLSERERELLGHLAEGCDTRQVAERMFLSPHTVQDHLKSVFAKTGTHSRRGLLGLLRQ